MEKKRQKNYPITSDEMFITLQVKVILQTHNDV